MSTAFVIRTVKCSQQPFNQNSNPVRIAVNLAVTKFACNSTGRRKEQIQLPQGHL